MAVCTGTVLDVHSFETPAGPKSSTDAPPQAFESCIVDATIQGTYVQGTGSGGFSIAAVTTAIAAARRDGRTYTIISASCCAPGNLNGSGIGAMTESVATNSAVAGLLTDSTGTAEYSAGALSTAWNEGIKFRVYYKAV